MHCLAKEVIADLSFGICYGSIIGGASGLVIDGLSRLGNNPRLEEKEKLIKSLSSALNVVIFASIFICNLNLFSTAQERLLSGGIGGIVGLLYISGANF
ncbi:MAG: hypothetical protein K1060chlam1_00141 [Candidatus Anoxychlamydiales bacterium]|nr:hypothetical protein [Candidatus Anoxychlamydiales bacterium]